MTTHMVQSTLFAGVIALLELAFRENAARVRHWLWMAASIKFLVPFSFLVGLGSRVQWRSAVPPGVSWAMESVGRSFAAPEVHFAVVGSSGGVNWSWVGGVVWLSGFAMVLAWWFARWVRVWAAVHGGRVTNPPQATSLPHERGHTSSCWAAQIFAVPTARSRTRLMTATRSVTEIAPRASSRLKMFEHFRT